MNKQSENQQSGELQLMHSDIKQTVTHNIRTSRCGAVCLIAITSASFQIFRSQSSVFTITRTTLMKITWIGYTQLPEVNQQFLAAFWISDLTKCNQTTIHSFSFLYLLLGCRFLELDLLWSEAQWPVRSKEAHVKFHDKKNWLEQFSGWKA